MRLRAKRRGSALIYTSVLMVAITTVVIGTVQLNLVAAQKAERRIDDAKAEETFNAQVALVTSVCKSNAISLPLTFSSTMNGQTLSCSVTDNDSSLLRSYRIESSGGGSLNRHYVKVIGGRQTTHPFYYALWTRQGLDATGTGISTTNGGHVYIGGNATIDSASSIAGDLWSVGSMTAGTATIARNYDGGQVAIPFYNPDLPGLKAESTSILPTPLLAALSYLSLLVNGHYALHYYDNAASMSGILNGKGTAVFQRSMTVTGNVTYLSGAARSVFIVNGDLTINPGVTRLDGMWYVTGNINAIGTTAALQNMRGSIVCNGSVNTTRPMYVTMDTAFWTGRNEALRHCVPGFWPTPVVGLMR